jgi:hypothetical protein
MLRILLEFGMLEIEIAYTTDIFVAFYTEIVFARLCEG